MKKLFALILVMIMIFSLAACGGGGNGGTTPDATPEPTPTPAATPPPVEIEGEFFPGIKDEDIPEILMRKTGVVESAVKIPSDNPDYSDEVFITLAEVPINFFSILSHHYQDASIEADVPLDESLGRSFTFDWGLIEMSSKDLLINEGKIEIHALIY